MPTHFVNRNQIRTQKCPTMWCTRSQVYMCKYVDQMAWLPCWLTRGQQVNLRNPLHTGNEACKQGILPDFETKVDVTRNPNRGVVAPQKGLMSLNKMKKQMITGTIFNVFWNKLTNCALNRYHAFEFPFKNILTWVDLLLQICTFCLYVENWIHLKAIFCMTDSFHY